MIDIILSFVAMSVHREFNNVVEMILCEWKMFITLKIKVTNIFIGVKREKYVFFYPIFNFYVSAHAHRKSAKEPA